MDKPQSKPKTKQERFEAFLNEHKADGQILIKVRGDVRFMKASQYCTRPPMCQRDDEYTLHDISAWRTVPHNGWRD